MHNIMLNKRNRDVLSSFARSVLNNDKCKEKLELDKAYQLILDRLTEVIKETIKPSELKVLKKFNCISDTTTVITIWHNERKINYSTFHLNSIGNKVPLPNFWRMELMPFDSQLSVLYLDWVRKNDVWQNLRRDKLRKYEQLIYNCKTLNELEEIWEEAKNAGIRINIKKENEITENQKEIIEFVKTDVKNRVKESKNKRTRKSTPTDKGSE
jgi:hypothetical protein